MYGMTKKLACVLAVLALMAEPVAAQQDSVAGKAPKPGAGVPPAQAKDQAWSAAVPGGILSAQK